MLVGLRGIGEKAFRLLAADQVIELRAGALQIRLALGRACPSRHRRAQTAERQITRFAQLHLILLRCLAAAAARLGFGFEGRVELFAHCRRSRGYNRQHELFAVFGHASVIAQSFLVFSCGGVNPCFVFFQQRRFDGAPCLFEPRLRLRSRTLARLRQLASGLRPGANTEDCDDHDEPTDALHNFNTPGIHSGLMAMTATAKEAPTVGKPSKISSVLAGGCVLS